MAISEFFRSGKNDLDLKSPDDLSRCIFPARGGPVQVPHQGLVASVKNPFEQDDWEAWVKFTASVGVRTGHDLDDKAEMNCQGYGLGIMQLPPA